MEHFDNTLDYLKKEPLSIRRFLKISGITFSCIVLIILIFAVLQYKAEIIPFEDLENGTEIITNKNSIKFNYGEDRIKEIKLDRITSVFIEINIKGSVEKLYKNIPNNLDLDFDNVSDVLITYRGIKLGKTIIFIEISKN